MTSKVGMMSELTQLCENFGHDEIEVLLTLGRRLKVGRADYGELHIDTDDRDTLTETAEEGLDQCAYMAMRVIAMQRLATESGCTTPNQLRRLIRHQREEIDRLSLIAGRRSCG